MLSNAVLGEIADRDRSILYTPLGLPKALACWQLAQNETGWDGEGGGVGGAGGYGGGGEGGGGKEGGGEVGGSSPRCVLTSSNSARNIATSCRSILFSASRVPSAWTNLQLERSEPSSFVISHFDALAAVRTRVDPLLVANKPKLHHTMRRMANFYSTHKSSESSSSANFFKLRFFQIRFD